MPLWHKDYFRLIIFKKQQTQEKLWKLNRSNSSVTAKRSNQSILKEINSEYSLERLVLKLKLQYFGHLMQTANSLEKTLMLERPYCKRRRGRPRINGWMASLTQWTWVWANSRRWWRTGKLQSMGWKRVRHDLVKEQHPFVRDIYMYKRNLHFLRVYQEEGDDQISRNSYQWRRYPQICKPNPCFLCFPSNLA